MGDMPHEAWDARETLARALAAPALAVAEGPRGPMLAEALLGRTQPGQPLETARRRRARVQIGRYSQTG